MSLIASSLWKRFRDRYKEGQSRFDASGGGKDGRVSRIRALLNDLNFPGSQADEGVGFRTVEIACMWVYACASRGSRLEEDELKGLSQSIESPAVDPPRKDTAAWRRRQKQREAHPLLDRLESIYDDERFPYATRVMAAIALAALENREMMVDDERRFTTQRGDLFTLDSVVWVLLDWALDISVPERSHAAFCGINRIGGLIGHPARDEIEKRCRSMPGKEDPAIRSLLRRVQGTIERDLQVPRDEDIPQPSAEEQ